MNKTRLVMLVGVVILSLALVGMALAADNAQKPEPQKPTTMTIAAPAGGQTDSLSGSYVAFDPSVGGDSTYIPGLAQTFCFRAETYTSDYGYVYNLWLKFPTDWTVNNAYVTGTPVCDSGTSWGTFSWSFQTNPYEINISHARYQQPVDHCVAYYCVDVVSGTGTPDALESWYWAGDNFGSPPYHPCSSDVYTPVGQTTCDESVNPPADIPPGELAPVMLTPVTQAATGCSGASHDYIETVWNNTGSDTTIDLSYTITAGTGSCTGPASVVLANGTTTDITVSLLPFADPGTSVDCQVFAQDEANPDNNATAVVSYNVISGGLDPAGWLLAPNTGAIPAQWQGCAVGTNPAAAGPVGYQVAGLDSAGGTQYNLQMFDPAAGTWTQLAAAPDNYFGQVTGWYNGKLYVAGGSDAAFIGQTDLAVYDPVTNLWDNTSYADLPVPRLGAYGGFAPCHTTGVGDCLYAMGGTPDGTFTDFTFNAWEYDPLTNIWTQLTDIPGNPANSGMALGGGVACEGKVYVGGDYRGIADFFQYDPSQPSGSEWTQIASIPPAAGKMTPAMVCLPDDNAIYLIGGDSLGFWGDPYNNKVFRYDIALNTWSGPITQTLNTGLLGSCGLYMDSKLWTFGGTNGAYAITPAPHESLEFLTCGPTGPINATKTATALAIPGDTIDYSITINNISPDQVAASMVDPIPEGATYVPGSLTCNSGECSYDAGLNQIVWAGDVGPAVKSQGIENIGDSTMNFIAPTFFPVDGVTTDLCFNVSITSPDLEYMDGFDFTLPADWTVNSVTDVPATGCTFNTHSYGVNPGNVVFWYTDGMPTGCGAWSDGNYNFCANVTVPAGCTAGWDLPWNIWGDTYGDPPHSVSGTAFASCGEPQALNPVTITFQATAGPTCPAVVSNIATISTEGFPDVFAAADTHEYCSLAPVITVNPLSLSASQPSDTITTQQLQICNEGPTSLDWSLTEVPGIKVTSVTPAPTLIKPSAINQPVYITHDPAITYNPVKPTDVLLDQEPNAQNGLFVDSNCALCPTGMQSVADNFTLENSAVINQLVFWSGYYPSDTPMNPDTIRVLFHQNSGGLPGAVVYDESNVAYTREQTGVILFGVHEWVHTLTFAAPVNLSAGTYWVEIFASAAPDDFFWETGNQDPVRGIFDATFAQETPGVTWLTPLGYDMAFQLIGTIGPVEGIPWLSEDPTSGTVNPFACTFVDVSFDSTGLTPGTYNGELDVNSNDPNSPIVPVAVALNVLESPNISITPNFLISTLFPNSQETQDLNVCNTGQTALDWSLAEVPGLKVNSVKTVPTATKPSHPVTLALDANGLSAPTGPAPKAPNGDVALVLDDGSRDNDIGIGGLQEFIWVNRFTPNPADFPFQINEVWIYFSSVGLVNVGDNIKIVFYENTTGGFDPAPGSAYLGGYVTTVQALDTWNVYTLPTPVGFAGPTGDAIIGVIGLEVPGSSYWPASIDQTTTQQRSWAGWWNVMPPPDPPVLPPDASWILIDDYFPGNWMVRGYGQTGADAIPWASETPTSGTVQPGDCTIVSVTFDSTGLAPLTYHGSLDFSSNDPDTPVFNVPLTLNVVAPDITVTPTSLDVTVFPGQTDARNMYIGNIGTANLTWSVADSATWLTEDPTSGTVSPSTETQVVVAFDSAGLAPGVYTTDVVITSNDPDQPETIVPATMTVVPFVADLSVVKTASAETVRVGEVFTYTLVVANAGPDAATGVMLVDTLPGLVTFVSASEGCTEALGVVTCDIGDLAVEGSVTVTITVTAADTGIVTNTAVVSGSINDSDPNLDNNTSTVDTTIIPAIYNFYLPIIQRH
jgi:uncharacterized repeat protein (TIGR01451 family)